VWEQQLVKFFDQVQEEGPRESSPDYAKFLNLAGI
jgi:hypothetical protein